MNQLALGGPVPPEATALEQALASLPEADRDFATSLLNGVKARGTWSPKQKYWAERLTQKARDAQSPDVIGDFTAIAAMFDKAGTVLKFPKVLLDAGSAGTLRLTIAGPNTRVPGSINVTVAKGDKAWLGRILRTGTMDWSGLAKDRKPILKALKAFAAEPSKTAMAYGRKMGCCCFCGRTLADPVSVAAGYGPICSERFGLDGHRVMTADAIASGDIT